VLDWLVSIAQSSKLRSIFAPDVRDLTFGLGDGEPSLPVTPRRGGLEERRELFGLLGHPIGEVGR
jgi:hypothetical protein